MKNSVALKPDFELVPLLAESAFIQRRFNYDMIDVHWHQHPEFELTYIENVSGKRIIGNEITEFKSGDLTLIGSNLPHLFKEDAHSRNKTRNAICSVIQFSDNVFKPEFLVYRELWLMNKLFINAKQGIYFHGEIVRKAKSLMTRIERMDGINRFTMFFRLLVELASTDEYEVINKDGFSNTNPANGEKDRIIYNHILENYTTNISIDEMAKLSNLSKGAFCNYFRKKTKKKFSEYINDLRCDLACRLLDDSDKSISEIAHAVGYENLSYFNRTFFSHTQLSPGKYRKRNSGVS